MLPQEQWAQAGRLIGAGVPRQQVAIIYDVGLSTLYRKFPAGLPVFGGYAAIQPSAVRSGQCPLSSGIALTSR